MKAHFEMFAGYNAWANERLYDAAATLSEEEARAELGAFFGSVHRTLNHIMVGDLIWLARFRGQRNPPFALDHVLHDDRAELRAARRVLDADILRHVDELSEADLVGDFTYRTIVNPATITQNRAAALAHFFNHQTHHRGQVHALLTRLRGDAPSLDMIVFHRESA
ncbi:damage-inducible protein DinB [Limibaculum sp. M0105]|uniref:Damage-inducible protein DinB n=1 Tax=Thermohalobaculum xanthum TaxID=2753746 RepID=A0A8J7M6W7_9RHOB|nr:DinB family protein [Thermohalobaculum xanthum]MBK0399701.1 damage-inducible protein DinB [Thermohalobaculum xanthum]